MTTDESTEPQTVEEIEAEIEATREELGATVDALSQRLDVKGRAQDKVADVKEQAQEKVHQVQEGAVHAKDAMVCGTASARAKAMGAARRRDVQIAAGGAVALLGATALIRHRRG